MPGAPVLYYGDEIGMGDNVYLGDRDGVRTPMQWSPDRNAGFSKANPQRLFLPIIIDPEYHYETVNVEAQQGNGESLLWWTKRMIALRKKHRAFSRGDIELLAPDNGKVLAFFRTEGEERILVVANMSRSAQYVELDLAAHVGSVPVELLGCSRFPPIGELPYLLTLGPHAYHWFLLQRPRVSEPTLATIAMRGEVATLFHSGRAKLEHALSAWLPLRRWFRGKSRVIDRTKISDAIEIGESHVLLVEVAYVDAPAETYVVPVAWISGDRVELLVARSPHALIARVSSAEGEGALVDALATEQFPSDVLGLVLDRGSVRGEHGILRARGTGVPPKLIDRSLIARAARAQRHQAFPPRIGSAEQSNSNVLYGDKLIMKILRAIEPGQHPEEELCRFLGERVKFGHVPRLLGALSYEPEGDGEPRALGVLQELVPNQGDAWEFTLDALQRYFEHVWQFRDRDPMTEPHVSILRRAREPVPDIARESTGTYLGLARLLGARTAQLHLALASEKEDPAFAPDPFTLLHQRSVYQSARAQLARTFDVLRRQLDQLPAPIAALARELLPRRKDIESRLGGILHEKIDATRTRVHGDLHLGQVLYAAGDFVFIDFEGEPARTLSERRRKRSPLRDVASMLRSFHYAAATALRGEGVREQDIPVLEPWARAWVGWVGGEWLSAWLAEAGDAPFVPKNQTTLARMLAFYLLEKCIYEVYYEINNRPDWLAIPLAGFAQLLAEEP
jgi:maltose alpha-D-glucosyltransferase / alpha-amylase